MTHDLQRMLEESNTLEGMTSREKKFMWLLHILTNRLGGQVTVTTKEAQQILGHNPMFNIHTSDDGRSITLTIVREAADGPGN
jgi:hypothetical protein